MPVIVGLGNPGLEYRGTRHNAGAAVVQQLARQLGVRWRSWPAVSAGETRLAGRALTVAVPRTFMNHSGEAIAALLVRTPVPLAEFLVVCDDVAIPFGTLRVRGKGSDGGHKGLRSIIERTGDQGFPRLRVGIGSPDQATALERFVLERFSAEEHRQWPVVAEAAAAACELWVRHGVAATMDRYNRKVCA